LVIDIAGSEAILGKSLSLKNSSGDARQLPTAPRKYPLAKYFIHLDTAGGWICFQIRKQINQEIWIGA